MGLYNAESCFWLAQNNLYDFDVVSSALLIDS